MGRKNLVIFVLSMAAVFLWAVPGQACLIIWQPDSGLDVLTAGPVAVEQPVGHAGNLEVSWPPLTVEQPRTHPNCVVVSFGDAVDDGASPVPEPATMILLGSGLVGLAAAGRKKFRVS